MRTIQSLEQELIAKEERVLFWEKHGLLSEVEI